MPLSTMALTEIEKMRTRMLAQPVLVGAAVLATLSLPHAQVQTPAPPTARRVAAAPAPATDIPRLPFEKITLSNGLEVIFSQDKRLPMVAVNLWYHVGPANE